jgi:hypothetical protein
LGHVHAYQTISSRRALSAMVKNQWYADVSPIADATIETTYRVGTTLLGQGLTVATEPQQAPGSADPGHPLPVLGSGAESASANPRH